jgi:hypothetical protein
MEHSTDEAWQALHDALCHDGGCYLTGEEESHCERRALDFYAWIMNRCVQRSCFKWVVLQQGQPYSQPDTGFACLACCFESFQAQRAKDLVWIEEVLEPVGGAGDRVAGCWGRSQGTIYSLCSQDHDSGGKYVTLLCRCLCL